MSDWEDPTEPLTYGTEARAGQQNALSLLLPQVKQVVEGALLAAGEPLSIDRIQALYDETERPAREAIQTALDALCEDYRDRAIELVEVASGWRVQVRASVAPWVGRLWQEKPGRYSRALLETLALIAYRQPITRGEIEQIRGVAVSTPIIKTLTEREWVRVVGHREVPGRPALYATTRRFLDYFGLRSLNELPPLTEIRDASFFDQALNGERDPDSETQPPSASSEALGRPHLVLAASNAHPRPRDDESLSLREGVQSGPVSTPGNVDDPAASAPSALRPDDEAS